MGSVAGMGTGVESPRREAAGIPWYAWCAAAAVTSAAIGVQWDLSWHRSVGRDTFWTPAHVAIYGCGVLAAISCGYLILRTSLWRPADMVARSVGLFGLRAPLGAFVAAWGGMAMLVAAPFDNWWHEAYGLDVRPVSPPHLLMVLGVQTIGLGAVLLAVGMLNRAVHVGADGRETFQPEFRGLQWLLLHIGGMLLVVWMFFLLLTTLNTRMHAVAPYATLSIMMPFSMAVLWKASRHPWANTVANLVCLGTMIGFILLLPMFPAEPKLGPVLRHITHFVPPPFPVLLIAPAVALDVFWARTRLRSVWLISLVSGILFVGVLVAVEWPFSSFLMTRSAENRFFGTMYHGFEEGAVGHGYFDNPLSGFRMVYRLGEAMGIAALSARCGLALGEWMRGVRR